MKLRFDPNKNSKFSFYLRSLSSLLIPPHFDRSKRDALLQIPLDEALSARLEYYNRLKAPFTLPSHATTISRFVREAPKKTYFFDLLEHLRYFDPRERFCYLFGDITTVPEHPSFLKSRPIEGDNAASVLLNLNKVRHFIFVNDTIPFEAKQDKAVWRGKAYRPHRKAFVERFYNHPKCDIGQVNTKGDLSVPWQKGRLSLKQQLEYKLILSIEGNDVASNLKWIMSSNSLTLMARPKFETWFMEGTLIPNHHYVLLQDDYGDLEEKIDYYSRHSDEAKAIIANANAYVAQFQNPLHERLLSLHVMNRYFDLAR